MKVVALCHTCRHRHLIDFDPHRGPGAAFGDWITRHPGPAHDVDFLWPERTPKSDPSLPGHWPGYLPNADVKLAYGASAAVTITLASLAASSTLLAGRESTAVDNGASNKYLDELLAGHFRGGAANLQAGAIRVAVVGNEDDTPTWPDVFDGTDSAETVTVQAMYDSVCRLLAVISTDATQRTWPFGPRSVASCFDGVLPDQWLVFVSHNAHTSTNVWSATESDHAVKRTPIFATVT